MPLEWRAILDRKQVDLDELGRRAVRVWRDRSGSSVGADRRSTPPENESRGVCVGVDSAASIGDSESYATLGVSGISAPPAQAVELRC